MPSPPLPKAGPSPPLPTDFARTCTRGWQKPASATKRLPSRRSSGMLRIWGTRSLAPWRKRHSTG